MKATSRKTPEEVLAGIMESHGAASSSAPPDNSLEVFLRRWDDVPTLALVCAKKRGKLSVEERQALLQWLKDGSNAAASPLLILCDIYNAGKKDHARRLALELQKEIDALLVAEAADDQ